jgi:hypothetical protein
VGELSHEPAHATGAVDRLLEQYKQKPNLEGVLGATVNQLQGLEDALWGLLTERWLDSAAGEQLDLIGRIVNLPRDAWADTAYRLLLKVEILSLRSSGRPEELISLASLALGAEAFELLEAEDLDPDASSTHAAVLIRALEALELPAAFYARLFRRAAAAGIRLLFEYPGGTPEDGFAFSSSEALETDDATGFGSSSDMSVGGRFAGITA